MGLSSNINRIMPWVFLTCCSCSQWDPQNTARNENRRFSETAEDSPNKPSPNNQGDTSHDAVASRSNAPLPNTTSSSGPASQSPVPEREPQSPDGNENTEDSPIDEPVDEPVDDPIDNPPEEPDDPVMPPISDEEPMPFDPDEMRHAAPSHQNSSGFEDYHSLQSILNKFGPGQSYFHAWAENHPDRVFLGSYGTSATGHPLYYLRISDYAGQQNQNEPKVMINFAMHGDEINTVECALHLIDFLVEDYPRNARVRSLVDHFEIIVTPINNPGGYSLSVRSGDPSSGHPNPRGRFVHSDLSNPDASRLDPNRSFPIFFENSYINDSGQRIDDIYPWARGDMGVSLITDSSYAAHPDADIVQKLVDFYRQLEPSPIATVDVHGGGELVLLPYGVDSRVKMPSVNHASLISASEAFATDISNDAPFQITSIIDYFRLVRQPNHPVYHSGAGGGSVDFFHLTSNENAYNIGIELFNASTAYKPPIDTLRIQQCPAFNEAVLSYLEYVRANPL